MKLIIPKRAEKELLSLDRKVRKRIAKALNLFEEDPGKVSLKKLRSLEDVWRIRVGGYRILLSVDWNRGRAEVLHILSRKDAYRG